MTGQAAAGEPRPEPGTSAEPSPAPGGQQAATGDAQVDAALDRLGELAGLPVTEHARVFDDVHRQLEDVLEELDTGQVADPGQGAAPGPGR
jgi:hypothetical protein